MNFFDIHTHSISSGHGTSCTITDMAKAAASRNLSLLGISDHGPATPCAGTASYFRSLAMAPQRRCGVELRYGVELNILDDNGRVDLEDEIIKNLDYAIVSIHPKNFRPGSLQSNTSAYCNALKHPKVLLIGHCDDPRYPVDYEELAKAAEFYHVYFEINNSSLSPNGYRGDVRPNYRRMLEVCCKRKLPVVLSSDSHGKEGVGDFRYAEEFLREEGIGEEMIVYTPPYDSPLVPLTSAGEVFLYSFSSPSQVRGERSPLSPPS